MVSGEILASLCSIATAILTRFHEDNPLKDGIGKEELRSRLYNGLDQKLYSLVIHSLTREKAIVVDQASVRLAAHKVSLKEDEQVLRSELEHSFRSAALSPPTQKDLLAAFAAASPASLSEVVALLVRDKKLVRVTEDLYFHRDALEDLKMSMIDYLKNNAEIDAQGFKELTGVTRKFSIPLMEYFDKEKVTIRIGNKRVLRK
jgi:selenocysteine-specific elongation factor